MRIFFSPIRIYSRVFSVRLSGAHHFRRLVHSQLSALVPQISPVHHSIFFNQRVISSFQLYLNSLKYLRSFSFLMVVLPGFSSLSIYSLSILPVVQIRPSQVGAISLLILSTRISSMPNPLLVINLIGEGYA